MGVSRNATSAGGEREEEGKTRRKKKKKSREESAVVDGYLLGIDPSILPNFLEKNTSPNPFLLPLTNLALTIKIPDRFRKRFCHVRVSTLKVIEDIV